MPQLKIAKKIEYILFLFFWAVVAYVFLSHLHLIVGVDKKLISECKTAEKEKIMSLQNGEFDPNILSAKQCDRLTLLNKDVYSHEIAFGPHERHIAYPGFSEKILVPGESYSFTLRASGTYELHDHLKESIKATLIVESSN